MSQILEMQCTRQVQIFNWNGAKGGCDRDKYLFLKWRAVHLTVSYMDGPLTIGDTLLMS